MSSADLTDAGRSIVDGPNFATVATIEPDGSPQTSIVWITRDGDDLLFSTVRGRRKTRNMEADPRVSVIVLDHANPYNYLEVRGSVTLDETGGRDLIDALSLKYRGEPTYGYDGPDAVRVVCRVHAHKVIARG
jgi:PPOX class probable F420-dependent enzyme